jgi:hypothetical protein
VGAGWRNGTDNAGLSGVYGEARLMYRPTFAVGSLAAAGTRPTMEAWYAGLAGGIEF